MSEMKQLLERAERAFDPPTDVMDALVTRRDRKRRNERIQAGALALVITVAIGWLGVSALRSGPVPADPAPVLPNSPESWSRVQLDPPVDGGSPAGFLVAGTDRLVAVGVQEGPATAWTSEDGATWTQAAAGDLDGVDISDVTDGDVGFIAVGDSGGARASWTSEDGISWDRLPDPAFGDTLFVSAVDPGGPGFVAVGSWMGAWYSVDGIAWERASVPPVPSDVYPGDDGKTPQIYLSDVAGWGDRLVATGYAMLTSDGNFDHPVVVLWNSRDGRTWTDVPTPADVFPRDSSISDVTAGPDGFVAVGRVADGQEIAAAIWTSPDGRDWLLHRPGPDGLVLNSVTAGASGYVAVGATMECDTDCSSREAVVMTSVDGETWVRVPSGPELRVDQPGDRGSAAGATMEDVVAWGTRFAALGEYDGEPTIWVTRAGIPEDVRTPTPSEPVPAAPSAALAYGVDGDVFLADADGSNAVKIADGVATEGECAPGEVRSRYLVNGTAWSPNGGYLAYWDWRPCPTPANEWGSVIISDAEGNVVASFPGQGWAISWSPDSTRVAVMDLWAPADGRDATIGIYGLDGTRQAALTVPAALTPSGDYSPVWSQDGSSILLHGVQVPLDGSAPTPVPNDLGSVYSPDGSRVAYLDGGYRGPLIVADAEGSDDRTATDPGEWWYVAWSPSGGHIAYTSNDRELLVRDVAAGTDTSLLDVARPERLEVIEFSPDGQRILFHRSDSGGARSLWSIGADGSNLRRLVDRTDWVDLRPHGDVDA